MDPFTIKPLDKKLILESARATKGRILTVEDHYYEGKEEADTGAWASEISLLCLSPGKMSPVLSA